jgi:hypothetical protein
LRGTPHGFVGDRCEADGGEIYQARQSPGGTALNRYRMLAVTLVLLSVRTAHSQIPTPPVNPWEAPRVPPAMKEGRFLLAAYYTEWQNPYRVTVAGTSGVPDVHRVSRTVRVVSATPASPLVQATYLPSRHLQVGFWYNPIRGEHLEKRVRLAPDLNVRLDLDRDVDLADLHVRYLWPHGWAVQIGYYRERGTLRDRSVAPPIRSDYTLVSWNFWLTKELRRRAFGRPTLLFFEAGCHPSSGLNHAASLLAGSAISLSGPLRLSGSVWLFDLARPATRVTAGFTYQF